MSFRVFTRTWWRENSAWPNGLEPHAGDKHIVDTVDTEAEARELCREVNSRYRDPRARRLSFKAEYEEA